MLAVFFLRWDGSGASLAIMTWEMTSPQRIRSIKRSFPEFLEKCHDLLQNTMGCSYRNSVDTENFVESDATR